MTSQQRIDALGWLGVLAVLTAYALVSLEFIESVSLLYIGLNISGAVGIALVAYYKENWQSVVLNVVWAGIALVSLGRVFIT